MLALVILGSTLLQFPQPPSVQGGAEKMEKSAYFAFVDRDFIFTLELIDEGVPIVNFVSMVDEENRLQARLVRLSLENRKVPGKYFLVDTGNPEEPIIIPSLRVKPRSAFGVRVQGDFGKVREVMGVTVGLGLEDFNLVPMSSFDFEKLVLKVNGINLGSPNFRDDWRVLKLETMGSRKRLRRRPQNRVLGSMF
jgi:hypothetical protein